MKLGIKIFCSIMLSFSVIFLAGGYILLSFFYQNAMEREVQAAFEQYQYNKFVIQSELITRGEYWYGDITEGLYDVSAVKEAMSGVTAVFASDHQEIYNEFNKAIALEPLLLQALPDQTSYQFAAAENRTYVMVTGEIRYGDTRWYLITGMDVGNALELQQQVQNKFLWVYVAVVVTGFCLSLGLSVFFTRPVNALTAAAKRIADGNYGERIAVSGQDEIGQLAADFNRMSAAVEEKVEELSESARRKEDFVANFAHELKTPLTSIIGYADRIYQKDLPRDEQKQAAWYIWNEGMRLEALAHKLMELTLFHHQDFLLEEMEAGQMLEELIGDVRYLAEEKGVTIDGHAEQAYIKIEYDLFKTLFLNLIDNAIKANAQHIAVNGKAESGFYVMEIADNGTGIPADELKRITEAFYMVDKSRSRKLHGAGIGLALSQRIAEIHGSTLEFESDGASGTTVRIRLY
ncbi:MAG: HAMP domain-containing histidine kinase [Clostridium sp.]|nr:HAMP domain-containing histidine kinase [Clostridium sp.]